MNIDSKSKGYLAKAKMILVEDQKNKPKELDYYKLARICKRENDNLNKKVINYCNILEELFKFIEKTLPCSTG